MNVIISYDDARAALILQGRCDSSAAAELESRLTAVLSVSSELAFDFSSVTSISSAGLRVLLGAHKFLSQRGGALKIVNPSREVCDVFDVTGFSDILTIEKTPRQVDISGCELIGAGMCGECYRLDEETILKLYYAGTPSSMVASEKQYARAAFVLGIPTAISYDTVMCNTRPGVVFELINAKTLSYAIREDFHNLEHYVSIFAQLAKKVHSTVGNAQAMRKCIDIYASFLPKISWLSEKQLDSFERLISELPSAETCIHGDFHPSNVMLAGDSPYFIDMGDFAIGNPLFDVAQVYNIFAREYESDLGTKITRLDRSERAEFWALFLHDYFGVTKPSAIRELEHEIRKYDCLRQPDYILRFPDTRSENIAYMRNVLDTL